MYTHHPPRSSSPIHKDNTHVLRDDIPAGLSFPNIENSLNYTGDSSRSLLAAHRFADLLLVPNRRPPAY